MKTALIFLAIAILLLILFGLNVNIWFRDSAIDVHVHDTYYVIARWHLILAIVLFLGTFSLLGGVLCTRFKNKFFLIAFIIFLGVDLYVIWKIYSLFNS